MYNSHRWAKWRYMYRWFVSTHTYCIDIIIALATQWQNYFISVARVFFSKFIHFFFDTLIHSLPVSVTLFHYLTLSIHFYLILSLYLSLYLSISLQLTHIVYNSYSCPLSLCVPVCISVYIYVSIYVFSLYLSLSVSTRSVKEAGDHRLFPLVINEWLFVTLWYMHWLPWMHLSVASIIAWQFGYFLTIMHR